MTVSVPSPTPNNMSRTDQQFPTRQSLIQLRADVNFTANALQYLGTLSREIGTPQWSPTTPDSINPNFQTLLVSPSPTAFPRNDLTTAKAGDPYINKRFNLQRLNWLTYNGPSATRTIPTKKPTSATDPDWDMWLLTSRFGLTSAFLQQGTAANILKYFGLAWDTTNSDPTQRERWNYVGHSGGATPLSSIATLSALTGTREPDFFELL